MVPATPDKPWYKYGLLWAAMVPPAAAVIGGLLSVWIAGGPPDLVVDDYGEIAMATQQRLERDRQAQAMALRARLTVDDDGLVRVQLQTGDEAFVDAPRLLLDVIHPTTASQDRRLTLEPVGQAYQGRIDWPGGRYYLQLSDEASSWRLIGETRSGLSEFVLRPASRGGRGR